MESTTYIEFFDNPRKAYFIDRPNMFLVRCMRDERIVTAYLPNPGKLIELLLPGRILYLVDDKKKSDRKTDCTVVGVKKDNTTVMLHTHMTNNVVKALLERNLISAFPDAEIISSEITYGRCRFDFFIKQANRFIYLEVKSCSLFGEKIAMFPDAQTQRGARHLKELAAINKEGIETAVIFLVNYSRAEFFMPDYHNDLLFARTFLECRNDVKYIPLSVEWTDDMKLKLPPKQLPVPWELILREAQDRGCYILFMELMKEITIDLSKGAPEKFKPGYYLYIGSSMAHLTKEIHKNYRADKSGSERHIDKFLKYGRILGHFPIRSSKPQECEITKALVSISHHYVPRFGCNDCNCVSHLFRFQNNPLNLPEFIKLLQYYRIDNLVKG